MMLCLALSLLLHVAILIQPIMIMARQALGDRPNVPVRLVSIPPELMKPIEELAQQDEAPLPDEEEMEGGVSFVAEGGVAVGYLDHLKVKIFRIWEYPEDAIASGADGTVRVRFVLDALGSVTEIGILSGSGHASLDSAALDAVLKAGPFGPFTEDLAGETLTITGSFCYVLD